MFQFVICPINDNNIFRFKPFFGPIPKMLVFSLYCDRWSNKLLSTVYFHSINLTRLSEGQWAECEIVCFLSIKKKKEGAFLSD